MLTELRSNQDHRSSVEEEGRRVSGYCIVKNSWAMRRTRESGDRSQGSTEETKRKSKVSKRASTSTRERVRTFVFTFSKLAGYEIKKKRDVSFGSGLP